MRRRALKVASRDRAHPVVGDVREQLATLPDESVHTVVTSPPYWGLRDYGVAGQIGLEATPAEFVSTMVEVFREVRRVLRADGTCWVNLGDSYATGAGKASSPGGGAQGEAFLAVVRVVAFERTEAIVGDVSPDEAAWGNYGPGRWGWLTDEPRALRTPLPWRGQQGFFSVPDSVIRGAL